MNATAPRTVIASSWFPQWDGYALPPCTTAFAAEVFPLRIAEHAGKWGYRVVGDDADYRIAKDCAAACAAAIDLLAEMGWTVIR